MSDIGISIDFSATNAFTNALDNLNRATRAVNNSLISIKDTINEIDDNKITALSNALNKLKIDSKNLPNTKIKNFKDNLDSAINVDSTLLETSLENINTSFGVLNKTTVKAVSELKILFDRFATLQNIDSNKVSEKIKEIGLSFSSIKEGLSGFNAETINAINKLNSFLSRIKDFSPTIDKKTGEEIYSNITIPLESMAKFFKDVGLVSGNSLVEAIKKELGIQSPALKILEVVKNIELALQTVIKKFDEIGRKASKAFGDNIKIGLEIMMKNVLDFFENNQEVLETKGFKTFSAIFTRFFNSINRTLKIFKNVDSVSEIAVNVKTFANRLQEIIEKFAKINITQKQLFNVSKSSTFLNSLSSLVNAFVIVQEETKKIKLSTIQGVLGEVVSGVGELSKGISKKLKEVNLSADDIGKVKTLSNFIKSISDNFRNVKDLETTEITDKINNSGKIISSLNDNLNNFSFINKMKTIKEDKLSNLTSLIKSISVITNSFTKMGKLDDIDKSTESFTKFLTSIQSFTNKLTGRFKLNNVGGLDKTIKSISALLNSFVSFAKLGEEFRNKRFLLGGEEFLLFSYIDGILNKFLGSNFLNLFSKTNRFINLFRNDLPSRMRGMKLEGVDSFIDALSSLLKSLVKFAQLGEEFRGRRFVLGDEEFLLFTYIDEVLDKFLGSKNIFAETFRKIPVFGRLFDRSILGRIKSISIVDFQQLSNFSNTLSLLLFSFSKSMKLFSEVNLVDLNIDAMVSSIMKLSEVFLGFDRVDASLRLLGKGLTVAVPALTLGSLGGSLGALGGISLGTPLAGLGGLIGGVFSGLKGFGSIFRTLFRGRGGIIGEISNIDFGAITKFVEAIQAISRLMNSLNNIKITPLDKERVELISQAIKDITGIFLNKTGIFSSSLINKISKLPSESIETFVKFANSVSRLISTLSSIDNVKFDERSISIVIAGIDKITNELIKVANKIKNKDLSNLDKFSENFRNIVSSFASNVTFDIVSPLIDNNDEFGKAGRENAKAYVDEAKDEFGIASPSKVFIAIGKNIVSGLKLGMAGIKDVFSKISVVFDDLMKKIGFGLNVLNTFNPFRLIGAFDTLNQRLFFFREAIETVHRSLESLFRNTTQVAMNTELELARIAKTLPEGTDEVALFAELEDMSTNPERLTSGLKDAQTVVSEIAASAGQLGIAGDEIAEFSEVIALLENATDLNRDEAGFGLARLSSITGDDNFEAMAGSLVNVGNNAPVTEREIMGLLERISDIDLDTDELIGWSAAIRASGIEAESGSSSFRRLFTEINRGDLSRFDRALQASNITLDEFNSLIEEDSSLALQELLEGVSQLSQREQIQFFEEAGINSVQDQRLISGLASNYEQLGEILQFASDGYKEFGETEEEYNALQIEALRLSETRQASLNRFNNVLRSFRNQLGLLTFDVFDAGINSLTMSLSLLTNIIKNNFDSLQSALNSILLPIGSLITSFGKLVFETLRFINTFAPISFGLTGLGNNIQNFANRIERLSNRLFELSSFGIDLSPSQNKESRTNQLLGERKILLEQINSILNDNEDVNLENVSHTIEQGDTLSELALRYGTTVEELQRLNDLGDSTLIITGEDLIISQSVADQTEERLLSLVNRVGEINRSIQEINNEKGVKNLITSKFLADSERLKIEFFNLKTSVDIFGESLSNIFSGNFEKGFDGLSKSASLFKGSVLEIFRIIFKDSSSLNIEGSENFIYNILKLEDPETQEFLSNNILRFLSIVLSLVTASVSPVGLGFSFIPIFADIIENDILGIGTALNSSVMGRAFSNLVLEIDNSIQRFIANIFMLIGKRDFTAFVTETGNIFGSIAISISRFLTIAVLKGMQMFAENADVILASGLGVIGIFATTLLATIGNLLITQPFLESESFSEGLSKFILNAIALGFVIDVATGGSASKAIIAQISKLMAVSVGGAAAGSILLAISASALAITITGLYIADDNFRNEFDTRVGQPIRNILRESFLGEENTNELTASFDNMLNTYRGSIERFANFMLDMSNRISSTVNGLIRAFLEAQRLTTIITGGDVSGINQQIQERALIGENLDITGRIIRGAEVIEREVLRAYQTAIDNGLDNVSILQPQVDRIFNDEDANLPLLIATALQEGFTTEEVLSNLDLGIEEIIPLLIEEGFREAAMIIAGEDYSELYDSLIGEAGEIEFVAPTVRPAQLPIPVTLVPVFTNEDREITDFLPTEDGIPQQALDFLYEDRPQITTPVEFGFSLDENAQDIFDIITSGNILHLSLVLEEDFDSFEINEFEAGEIANAIFNPDLDSNVRDDIINTFLEQFQISPENESLINIANSIVNGLNSNFVGDDTSENFATRFINDFESVLDIDSPSKVFKRIGGDISKGLDLGLDFTSSSNKIKIFVSEAKTELEKIIDVMERINNTNLTVNTPVSSGTMISNNNSNTNTQSTTNVNVNTTINTDNPNIDVEIISARVTENIQNNFANENISRRLNRRGR